MAAAVTTPIMATTTMTTYDVGQDGQATLVHQTTGTFARASDGRELTLTLDPKTNQPATAILRADGKDYSIKYGSKLYTEHDEGPLAPYAVPFVPKPGQESKVINGIYTVANPVYDANKQVIGKSWMSPQYKITVLIEYESTMPNGKTIRQVMEMTNIKIGTEPDASVFAIPPGFTDMGSFTIPGETTTALK